MRRWLNSMKLAVAVTLLLASWLGVTCADSTGDPFCIVALPDTQFYSASFPHIFASQTKWIADHKDEMNIVFVVHEGDIVDHSTEQQWENADKAMSILDGVVPYALAVGNHDIGADGTDLFNKHFSVSRFEKESWYGGHFGSNNNNSYCLFEAGEMKFLVFSLTYGFGGNNDLIAWAGEIIKKHDDHRVIVVTHGYLGWDGTRGRDMWEKFVSKHENIFLVLCGHIVCGSIPGTARRSSIGSNGNTVHQVLSDYQSLPNGGDGYLRVMRFVPKENKIYVTTYSPFLRKSLTNDQNEFVLPYEMTGTIAKNTQESSENRKKRYKDHVVWVAPAEHGPRLVSLSLEETYEDIVATKKWRELLAPAVSGASVEIGQVLTERELFDGATIGLTIRNKAAFPLKAVGRFKDDTILNVHPGKFDMSVPASSEKTIDLRIVPRQTTDPRELPPVVLNWDLSFSIPNTKLCLTGTERIFVEKLISKGRMFAEDFSSYENGNTGEPLWQPMSGKWKMEDGRYHQLLTDGYDYCATPSVSVKGDYQIEARLRLVDGTMEGGLMFNMPSRVSKYSSQMVRFSGHETLWAGSFSTIGEFSLEHSVPTGIKAREEKWAALTVTVRNSRGTYDLTVNGNKVAEGLKLTHKPRRDEGSYFGLVACRGHVAYDWVKVISLKE